MPSKLLTAFLIVFIGTSLLGSIMAGGGGIVSTTLSANITDTDEFIPASSTGTFSNKDVIVIAYEKILYDSKNSTGFSAYTRGYDDTVAVEHAAGSVIYTEQASVLNSALGYDIGVELDTSGTFAIIMIPLRFFSTTLPHLLVLNVNFLTDNDALALLGIFWLAASIGLLVDLAIRIAPIAVSMVRGLLGFLRG